MLVQLFACFFLISTDLAYCKTIADNQDVTKINPCTTMFCAPSHTCVVNKFNQPVCQPTSGAGDALIIIQNGEIVQSACNCPLGIESISVVNGNTKCVCKENPCNLVDCFPNYTCVLNSLNKPQCVPIQKTKSLENCNCENGIENLIFEDNEIKCVCAINNKINPCAVVLCLSSHTCVVNQFNQPVCQPIIGGGVKEGLNITCPKGEPLPNVFCGRGPNREDCPKDYFCNVDPLDRFAVCCPNY